MTALVIAEHDNASLMGATLNTVQAAAEISMFLDGQVHVLVVGHQARAVAQAATAITGVSRVIHADGAQFAHGLYENAASQVLNLALGYSHILFPSTAGGKSVAPRVAAKLGVAQISEITKVVNADTFEHPIYAGNGIATVHSSDPRKVITVCSAGFDSAGLDGSAEIMRVHAVADVAKAQYSKTLASR